VGVAANVTGGHCRQRPIAALARSTLIYAIDCTTTNAVPIPIVTKAAVRNLAKSIVFANCDTPKAIANCTALNPAK
jgi:hypothetical protein